MLQDAADQAWQTCKRQERNTREAWPTGRQVCQRVLLLHASLYIFLLPPFKSNESHQGVGHATTVLTGPHMRLSKMKAALCRAQANPYFCAGRVTVPAVMDTFASTTFLKGCASCIFFSVQRSADFCQISTRRRYTRAESKMHKHGLWSARP